MKLMRPGFLLGLGAGYVLGARTGRERYEQIRRSWSQLRGSPKVQQAADRTKELAGDSAKRGMSAVQQGVGKAGAAVKGRFQRENRDEGIVDLVEPYGEELPPPPPSPDISTPESYPSP